MRNKKTPISNTSNFSLVTPTNSSVKSIQNLFIIVGIGLFFSLGWTAESSANDTTPFDKFFSQASTAESSANETSPIDIFFSRAWTAVSSAIDTSRIGKIFTRASTAESSANDTWLKKHISIENRATFRYKDMGGDKDADFDDYWYARGRNLFAGRLDTYFSGRLQIDLNSRSNSLANDLFTSVEDRESGWNDQVYQLYGDIHDVKKRFSLRFGRQYIIDAEALHIDGGLVNLFADEKFNLSLFYGQPVSYYSGTSDDWTGGTSISYRPWTGNRDRLTYIYYKNDSDSLDDNYFAFDVWQRIGTPFRTHGRLTVLDGDFHTGSLDFRYYGIENNFDGFLTASYWNGLSQESREFSPIFSVFGELEPYTYITTGFSWMLTPWLSVSPTLAGRFVDAADKNLANRDYRHYFLTFVLTPIQNWTYSISGNYWDVNDGDRFWGTTGEVKYRSPQDWDFALGTSYMDWQYSVISDFTYSLNYSDLAVNDDGTATRISPDVYTVFTRIKYKLSDKFSLRIKGEIENNSVESATIYGIRTALVVRY